MLQQMRFIKPEPVMFFLFSQIHLSFEDWFLKQFRQDLLPAESFSIKEMKQEYFDLCQKEEHLWKEWCDNVKR